MWCQARRWNFTGTQPEIQNCGHQTCTDDETRHREGYEHQSLWACPAGACALAWLNAECQLPAGHAGAHDFGERVDPIHWPSSLDFGPDALPAPQVAGEAGR